MDGVWIAMVGNRGGHLSARTVFPTRCLSGLTGHDLDVPRRDRLGLAAGLGHFVWMLWEVGRDDSLPPQNGRIVVAVGGDSRGDVVISSAS